jgi:hypothetical protein
VSATENYVILVTARRWRWLPWPTNTFMFTKRTTWQEAYHLANQVYEGRAHKVTLCRGAQIRVTRHSEDAI